VTGERVLAGTRRSGVLVGTDDLLAFGALRATMPGELAAVGCDDIDFAAVAAVPLTVAGTRPSSRGVLSRAGGRGESGGRFG